MSKFTVVKVKSVTLPVLKVAKNVPLYFEALGAMYVGKKLDDQKEAATLLRAINLETGEEGLIVCAMVMQKELNEAYANDSYVGKCFELILHRVPEKRYNIVSLTEIAKPSKEDFLTDADKATASEAAPAAKTDTLAEQEIAERIPPKTTAQPEAGARRHARA